MEELTGLHAHLPAGVVEVALDKGPEGGLTRLVHERVKQDGHCVVVEVAVGGAEKAPKTSRDKIRMSVREVSCLAEMYPQNK